METYGKLENRLEAVNKTYIKLRNFFENSKTEHYGHKIEYPKLYTVYQELRVALEDKDWNEEGGRCPNFEKEMTPEEINEGYFVCSECGMLAERGRLEMPEGSFMCTQCGYVHTSGEKANEN